MPPLTSVTGQRAMNARRQPHHRPSDSGTLVPDGDGISPDNPAHPSLDGSPDSLIPASLVPKYLPRCRRGKKVHRTTVLRWMSEGCRGVVLGSILVGGR